MSRVLILGVTGGVGSRFAAQRIGRGDQAVGLHRHLEQANALRSLGIEPVIGDLTSIGIDALAAYMMGADTVVFAAGAPDSGNAVADAVDG